MGKKGSVCSYVSYLSPRRYVYVMEIATLVFFSDILSRENDVGNRNIRE